MKSCISAVIGLLLAGAALGDDTPAKTEQPRQTFWIIPHTHWEGAVFKTREEYLQMGLPHIVQALELLRTQPDYKFVLDQVAYVRPFLERHPELEAEFRKYVKEGRLELVLGLNVMCDDNMPGGETFIRSMLYGKRYYREMLGKDVTAAWFIDTFGHHAQLPQLLRQGGYTSFWFSRGVPRADFPSEFLWEGLDGTRMAAFWLPFSYGLMYASPNDSAAFRDFVKQRFAMLEPNSSGPHRLGLAGVDVCPPEAHLTAMINQYNQQADASPRLRLAVPSEFERVIANRLDRPVFQGELNPIFQGTYSSRIELKQWMRTMESLLTNVEKLGVIAHALDPSTEIPDLARAWDLTTFNQTHDLASGVMTDHVYEDTIRTYEEAQRIGVEAKNRLWNVIEPQVDTTGPGIPVVVFNPLAWERDDLVELDLDVAGLNALSLEVVDPNGQRYATQLVEEERDPDNRLKRARVAFLARNVPSIGYRVFHIVEQKDPAALEALGNPCEIESDLYKVAIDPKTGAVTSLRTKTNQREYLSAPANVIARQVDKGDLWELKRGLDGGSKVAMTDKQRAPTAADAVLSTDAPGDLGMTSRGPVFCEFTVEHPLGNGTFKTKIRVIEGIRRIEFATTLVNNEKYVHYFAMFPTALKPARNVQEIPFGAIERPEGVEFPAQNWSEIGDNSGGVALLNAGLPGNLATDGTLMVSLLRSHNLGAYGFGGGYEPGMSSETGFQIGIPRTLRYALVPHEATWAKATVYRDGLEFNHPLEVRVTKPHTGRLPKTWGLLTVSNSAVVLSALKLDANKNVVARFYEATGEQQADFELELAPEAAPQGLTARALNLVEDAGYEIASKGRRLSLTLRPFGIRTIALEPKRAVP